MRRAKHSAAFLGLCTSAVIGQQVTTWRVDDLSVRHRSEVALGISQVKDDVIVAWHEHITPLSNRVHYNVSMNGLAFRPAATVGPVPLPSGASLVAADPMVCFAADGTGWVGHMAYDEVPRERFWLSSYQSGNAYVNQAEPVADPGNFVDKGVLVAGPPAGGGSDVLRLVYTVTNATVLTRLRAINDPPASAFPVGPTSGGNSGGPNGAVIVPTTLGTRWVVAYHEQLSSGALIMPSATWSGNDGATWTNSVQPRSSTVHGDGSGSQQEVIAWFNPNDAVVPVGGPYVLNTPSIASDPSNPNVMYMAFLGRTLSGSVNTALDNVDLFIARSTDRGENFSGIPAGREVLRLRDVEDLDDPQGSIQFLPAIAVTSDGAIHVTYYVAWKEGGLWKYRVKMASMAAFNSDPGPSADPVWTLNLTGIFDMEDSVVTYITSQNRVFFGDYIMASARGCEVWTGYVSAEGLPSTGVFVTKVNFCLDADVNHDGALTNLDPAKFVEYFAAGDPRADLNRNAHTDTGDVARFLESFACGCNPP
ncbi:MAG: hypothetical protein KF678_12670 [Phycisphaeraceae bacterium]|nr:hypothetical protein [Phycisphaeraceae bacterium]